MTPSGRATDGWWIRDRVLPLDATLVMGILNVTPDSFSDGGLHDTLDSAVAWAQQMAADGADIIDVGGESTRPGADPVPADVEIARVVPVIERLAAQGLIVSVDTMKTEVAGAAIEAGAAIVNDVAALRAHGLAELCGRSGVGVVLTHMLGTPQTMQDDPTYDDVVAEVAEFLLGRVAAAVEAGVDSRAIALDPGIGFGKTVAHNIELIDRIDSLVSLGFPVVVGTSRKSFLGSLLGAPERDRDVATAVTSAVATVGGARVLRVHNVPAGRDAARVADAMVRARSGE